MRHDTILFAELTVAGLIAIMLGRLKMTVKECIDAYTTLSDTIFKKKYRRVTLKGKLQGRFDTEALEEAIKDMVTKSGLVVDALLKDEDERACKVYVALSPSSFPFLI